MLINFERLFDQLTKLSEDCLLIIAMTTAVKQPGATSHEAVVLLGPFNDFHILGGEVHDLDSSMALFTARS